MRRRSETGIGMTSARTRERLIRRLAGHGIRSEVVLERIRSVPRHLFVDEALESRAYEDSALPIGHGQTISQPYIVALMTQALIEAEPDAGTMGLPRGHRMGKVLEVGTGCGYQTAVLSPLVRQLFTIERVGSLLKDTRERLRAMEIGNVRFRHGDGMAGWPGQAPFDGIIVAAAPADVPQRLLEQLAPGGRLVMPVGEQGRQQLLRIVAEPGGYRRERLGWVSFVPMLEGTG